MATTGFETGLLYSSIEPDFTTMMMQLHEWATDIMPNGITRFPTLTYRRRTTPDENLIDDLHFEVLPANRVWVDYELPIFVEAQPKRQELTRFGIDEPRDLLAYFALPVLEENSLVIQENAKEVVSGQAVDVDPATKDGGPLLFLVNIGDRIFFQHYQYSIQTIHEDQFFGNTEIPCWLVAACSKWRPNVPADPTLDDTDDDWRDDPLNPDHALS